MILRNDTPCQIEVSSGGFAVQRILKDFQKTKVPKLYQGHISENTAVKLRLNIK